jgi:peptide/nickel transport system substrate-binding protein
MYGDPALPHDFVSLPYANPDAPKGGRLITGNTGGYDSLNPFVLKGTPPWQLRYLTHESLMMRSWDEPMTIYGRLAESIEGAPTRSWVEFTLNPLARFSDGTPVTAADVIWSYQTLGTQGHPRYHALWQKIASIAETAPGKIRMTFTEPSRELALIAGLRPILQKAQWQGVDFAGSDVNDVPIGSAPYMISSYEAGRNIVLQRDPNYWGNDLPIRRGTNNFDEILIEFYGDNNVMFEAFKAGEISFLREFNAEKWHSQFNFPAVIDGSVTKTEIPHQKPTGITGFVMNTRREKLRDIRVRDALTHAFNFEFINEAMTGQRQTRITSYFSNSVLAKHDGAASGRVATLLSPYRATLPPEAYDGYQLPVSDGTERNRRNIRKAIKLLNAAGWSVQNGIMKNAAGEPLAFDILIRQANQRDKTITDIYRKSLERLGVSVTVSAVDDAQYNQRITSFDFDITDYRRFASLSPGIEQELYWGSKAADQQGSRNLMGLKSPAMDAMITALLNSETVADYHAAARAIDRILAAGRYVIPIWGFGNGRIAHKSELRYPTTLPLYGDGVEWMPAVWWYQKD